MQHAEESDSLEVGACLRSCISPHDSMPILCQPIVCFSHAFIPQGMVKHLDVYSSQLLDRVLVFELRRGSDLEVTCCLARPSSRCHCVVLDYLRD